MSDVSEGQRYFETNYCPPERQTITGVYYLGDVQYHAPKCPSCGSRRTKRLAEGYPVRQCQDCMRSSLYGDLIPEKEPK